MTKSNKPSQTSTQTDQATTEQELFSDKEIDRSEYYKKIKKALLKHVQYFDSYPWPSPTSEAFQEITQDFVNAAGNLGASPDAASIAFSLMRQDPPQFKTDHLPAFIKTLEDVKRGNPAQPDGESAIADPSKPCDRGCVEGYLMIYRREYNGGRTVLVDGRPFPGSAAIWCDCPRGKHVRRCCLKNDEARDYFSRRPMPSPQEVGTGRWANWTRFDPTSETARTKEAAEIAAEAAKPIY